ncbi:MAG: glycosyltransferase [Ignavibacteriaceae bacterium]
MKNPLISIIMPVYNVEDYLRYSIESILTQTLENFEFIIIDDGSKDNSRNIIKDYKDRRIKFFERENKGIAEQLNFGIHNSSAEIIARMDGDDICNPERLEYQFRFLVDNPEIDLIGTNIIYIDETNREIVKKEYPELHEEIEYRMPMLTSVCHPSIMVKKSSILKIGGYRKYEVAQDLDLYFRMLISGAKFYNIQEYLLKYRFYKDYLKSDKLTNQNLITIKLAGEYLNNIYAKNHGYDYYFKNAMLNYYHREIKKARLFFFSCLIKILAIKNKRKNL